MEAVAERLRGEGRRPYVIPGGGSNPVGALGYVTAALELVAQAAEMGLRIDHVVHATGSAGTQAGLVTGLVALNSGIPVLGIGVRAPREKQEANVLALAERTAEHLGLPGIVRAEHVVANCDYVGQGYGIPTEGMVEAVRLVAENGRRPARPGVLRQGHGGADRPRPEGLLPEGLERGVPAHGRSGRAVRLPRRLRAACRSGLSSVLDCG